MRRKAVTISDVAEKIGCSPSAVSRALNNKAGISETVRSQICLTAMDMGYDFKRSSVSVLGKNTEQAIGFVITRENFVDEHFYRAVLHGVESVLNEKNIAFFLSIIEKNGLQETIDQLKQRRPKGLLLFGLLDFKILTDLLMLGIPMVLVDTVNLNFQADRLTVGNYRGSYEAVRYLWQVGHRRIAFLGDPAFSHNILQRYEGCRDYMAEQNSQLISAEGIVSMHLSGKISVHQKKFDLFLSSAERPTALVCASDQIAFAVYQAVKDRGLCIPQDISVIGFDNVEKCEWMDPPLTSVHVPKFEMGKKAVHVLLDRIASPQSVTALLQLDTKLKIRRSVASLDI